MGFIPAAAISGLAARSRWDRRFILGMVATVLAHTVILACGAPVLCAVAGLSWEQTWRTGVAPFLLGGVVKSVACAVTTVLAWRVLGARSSQRLGP